MDKSARLLFSVKKGDHVYEYSAPMGAPFGATHDALYEIIEEVLSMAKERHAQVSKEKEVSQEQDA